MATIPWGKPTIEVAHSVNGVPVGEWTTLDTPKEGTTVLNTTAGDKREAKEEGGKVVDVKYTASNYSLEFQLFVKKGGTRPFVDSDGLIDGEWALRLTPEDPNCEGFQIDKSTVNVEETYSAEDGKLLKYTFSALKPAEGNILKPYIKGSLELSDTMVVIDGAGGSESVTASTGSSESGITYTAAPAMGEEWLSASVSGNTITITATANTGASRTGHVSVVASTGASATLTIHQGRNA